MKLIFNAQAQRFTNHELDGIIAELRRDIGACDQRRSSDAASLALIRAVQMQRRRLRPQR
jgi:hypothetical protein